MSPNRLRWLLVALITASAVLSVIANKISSAALGWVAFLPFFVAVVVYFRWRRALHNVRKADETRSRTDQ